MGRKEGQSKTDIELKRSSAQRGASPRIGFTIEYSKERKRGETMTNTIKLGTLVKLSATTSFWLHDIQYDIYEFYTSSQILENKQLSRMKVISFKALSGKEMLYVRVEE